MSTYQRTFNQPHLIALDGGNEDAAARVSKDPRRHRIANYIPHLIVAGTVLLSGHAVVDAAERAVGPTPAVQVEANGQDVAKLKQLPNQVTITPVNQQAASEGASGMGELIDPQVYQGNSSSTAETTNLNAAIAPDGVKLGQSYNVPVLDKAALEARLGHMHNTDYVIGPIK